MYDAGKQFTRSQPLALEVIHSRLAASVKYVVIIPINIKRLDEYVKVHKYVIVVSIFFFYFYYQAFASGEYMLKKLNVQSIVKYFFKNFNNKITEGSSDNE